MSPRSASSASTHNLLGALSPLIDADVVDQHRNSGDRRVGRAAAKRTRETAAHSDVQDDEEAVVGGVVPGRFVDLVRPHGEIVRSVQIPADLLGGDAVVALDPILVKSGLTSRARDLAAPESRELVAWVGRIDGAAVQRAEHGAASVDVLHEVDL